MNHTTNPQDAFTAELAERTVLVRWPDSERRGATPPADDWQDRAWSSQSTLHEIDEGSITGCSVLRWRNDPRPDAELIAVSLALVSGAPLPAVSPSAVVSADRATLRDRIAEALEQADYRPDMRRGDLADAIMPVLPTPADRAAVRAAALCDAADFYERVLEQSLDPGSDPRYCTAVRDIVMGLRRRAAEEQPAETQACGRTKSVAGTEHPPCARPAGHEEAYCRSADGRKHFLAVGGARPAPAERPVVVEQPDTQTREAGQ